MNGLNKIFKKDKQYTILEVANKLRTAKDSVFNWIERGQLKATKKPHPNYSSHFVYWIKGSDVLEYLNNLNK